MQPRFPPIGNSFLEIEEEPCEVEEGCQPELMQKRRHSFSHIPYDMLDTVDQNTVHNQVEKTLMVRNLAAETTLDQFLKDLEFFGFFAPTKGESSVDFVYLPYLFGTSKQQKQSKGYAFVNFTNEEEAQRFSDIWKSQKSRCKRRRICICEASVQGLHANLTAWQKSQTSRIRSHRFMPVVIRSGWPIPCSEFLSMVNAASLNDTAPKGQKPSNGNELRSLM